ncbi:hypothetical protein F4779DRAFT_535245 [Xylariaceae sp. FL0662B]|nr:hypothetical protein F4779DRAFT_535245 [Xylariaceae sp. FL0662B]
MLAARDQENLVFNRQNGAALKQQQQQGQVNRQLQPKTPGARYPKTPIKVPLNDENGTHAVGGGKSIMGGRSKGNENVMTTKGTKGTKGLDKSNFVTPLGPRSRAPLGDKTTNAKATNGQKVNVKSAVQEIEKSQAKVSTVARPKQKQPQVESQKLNVHAETDPLSEDDVEYCPPKPKDLPYESDVFPDGVLTFEALKPENRFKGFYQYYFNPVDEHGVSLADRQLEERNRKAMEEGDKRIKEDMDKFEWCIEDELDSSTFAKKKTSAPASGPTHSKSAAKEPITQRAPSTIRSRKAADTLAMDDTTKSLQRRAARSTEASKAPKKTTPFAISGLKTRKRPNVQASSIPRKTSTEHKNIEATSRTTIGYNKGRSTASLLAKGTVQPSTATAKAPSPVSDTALPNDSDQTITPARYAHNRASSAIEDQQWKERVPFLSIFNPEIGEDNDDCDLLTGGLPSNMCEEEEEDFELKLID